MFRRPAAAEEPRFLKDLLQALRDSEEDLANEDAAAEILVTDGAVVAPRATAAVEAEEIETLRAEIALWRQLSAEWKEAVRLEREQSSYLIEWPLAA